RNRSISALINLSTRWRAKYTWARFTPSFLATCGNGNFSKVDNRKSEIDEGILHDILRLGIGQAGVARDVTNQPRGRIERLPPSLLVLPVAQAREQASPGGQQRIGS